MRSRYPATFQWVLERVKPERDQNARAGYRDNWWIFGEARRDMRLQLAGLPRYIATVETAKHRAFQFLDASIAPDNKLICIALNDAFTLGTLSSSTHYSWAKANSSSIGMFIGDVVYVKTRRFETFPFPTAAPEHQTRIANLAEQLDAHRKRQQAQHATLTLTGMYNVLAKIRAGEPLTAKDQPIHEQGLVSVLRSLHGELDAAVLAAYGWADLNAPLADPERAEAAGETLLERLVALNQQRRREEAAGQIRWLRPAYQNPQTQIVTVDAEISTKITAPAAAEITPASRHPWPATLPEQMALLAQLLNPSPQSQSTLAAQITGKGPWKKRLPDLLQTLVALGRARTDGDAWCE